MKIKSLHNKHDEFPRSLHDLHAVPDHVAVAGSIPSQPTLAVVGSRRMSEYGKSAMQLLLPPLVEAGVGIVSGLAFGVDIAAHKHALDRGAKTWAVVPSALPEIYPRSHQTIAQSILSNGGGLISEFDPPHSVRREHFLQRNRLVAALSDAVLVVEAAERSGTSSTVRHALDLGRPVLAIPGRIDHAGSKGTNRMIYSGAVPALCPQDIADQLKIDLKTETQHQLYNEAEATIVALLRQNPLSALELQQEASLQPQILMQHLTELELRGIVMALGAQQYSLRQ